MLRKSLYLALPILISSAVNAQTVTPQDFNKLTADFTVGNVKVKPSDTIDFPTLIWGGDVALLRANGGERTLPTSTLGKLGVKIKTVSGDDFIAQTKRYLAGDTPFGRCEMGMLGIASESLNSNPKTKPVLLYQETFSAGGDCFIGTEAVRTVNDLKPKNGKKVRVALQTFGPHMNLLNIILANAKMSWDDIDVVWCKDLAVTDAAHPDQGDSPAARMRRGECDVCFVISPERNGLTGGVKSVGNGKEGTVKGAKQILSTATLSRGVADVVYVRKDFYDAYPDYCKKLTAGYIRGTYDLMEGQTDWLAGKKTTEPAKSYIAAITYAKKYFGEAAIPEVTVDGVGMVQDAEFMGIPGNISFFQDSGNLNNFERMQTEVLNLANTLKVTKVRSGFLPAPWDWKEIASLAGVKYTEPNKTKGRIAESVDLLPGDEAISEFTVNFQPDQDTFNVDTYGDVLDHTIKMAASYRSGVVLVRGHTDVSKTLFDLVVALKSTGAITESGNGTAKQYFLNGEPLDLTQTPAIMKLIAETQFDGFPRSVTLPGKGPRMIDKPSDDVAAMDALSRKRAEAFKAAVIARATAQKVNLDASQIQITGVGVREPLVKRPKNADEAKKNMRVEIQVREVGSEALSSELFEP